MDAAGRVGGIRATMLALVSLGCWADPNASACTLLCSVEGTCPSGMACQSDGYCHEAEDERACSAADAAPPVQRTDGRAERDAGEAPAADAASEDAAAGPCGTLLPEHELVATRALASCDGRFSLALRNGDLVLDWIGVEELWSADEADSGADRAVMQGDGNFVLYRPCTPPCPGPGEPVWDTDTAEHPGCILLLPDDGNLVVYSPDHEPLWNSETAGH